jgi:hypothetical protein
MVDIVAFIVPMRDKKGSGFRVQGSRFREKGV